MELVVIAKVPLELSFTYLGLCKSDCESIKITFTDGLVTQFLLEWSCNDPVGALRRRPYMRGEQVETALQCTRVDYRAYDKPYGKMTDLCTSFDWSPSGNTGNGRCNNGRCGMGSESKEGDSYTEWS